MPGSPQRHQLRIVIVDDEAGMRTAAARVLHGQAVQVADLGEEVVFGVETCATGEEFLDGRAYERCDLLLLDCKLPGIGGVEILERLPALCHDLCIVMISAYATLDTAVRTTKLGAFDFLSKPFTPDELRHTVRKAARTILLGRRARQLAEEKRRVRFEFISVLAHELKSPLGAVQGYLDLMRGRAAGDSLGGYGEMIERSLLRLDGMRKLIADLLDLTGLESGQRKRCLARCCVADVLRQVIDLHRESARAAGISLSAACPPDLAMEADPGELEMLLGNLVSNAVKYNRPGGRVDAQVAPAGGAIAIRVSDTGIGMSEEECGRLFGEFVRIRNESTKGIAGSGLGLSIVKKVAALYDGEVTVSSRPGEGSTFTVTLKAGPKG